MSGRPDKAACIDSALLHAARMADGEAAAPASPEDELAARTRSLRLRQAVAEMALLRDERDALRAELTALRRVAEVAAACRDAQQGEEPWDLLCDALTALHSKEGA